MAIAAKNENICPNGRMNEEKREQIFSSLRHKIEQRGAVNKKKMK
jgi:hypothetical protein